MLIDFHTHIFPPTLAPRALGGIVDKSRELYGIDRGVCFDGTPDGLRALMRDTGVDISVAVPIATKPGQYKTINDFAAAESRDGITSLASLHPYDSDTDGILDDIARRGFWGIKLHPDYQGVFADDPKFIALVRGAQERGLYAVLHSGEDLGVLPPFHCTAPQLTELLKKVDDSMLVLAHMGGFNIWDDILERFCGCRAYFDTAVVSRHIDPQLYRRIIDRHGAERILFGSDAPWEDPRDTLAFLNAAGLSDAELALIKHKNAEKLLGARFAEKNFS